MTTKFGLPLFQTKAFVPLVLRRELDFEGLNEPLSSNMEVVIGANSNFEAF